MPNNPKPSIHAASFSLAELQQSIRNDEALSLSLKSIDIAYVDQTGGAEKEIWTISNFDWGDVDFSTLEVIADTTAGLPSPAGMKLVCRGRAMIGGTETKVVAFRKQ